MYFFLVNVQEVLFNDPSLKESESAQRYQVVKNTLFLVAYLL